MNIAIVGTGYVGLVTGVCFAEMGVDVWCVDVDKSKIDALERGIIPIYEEGLKEIFDKNYKDGRVHFTTDLSAIIDNVDIVFIAVGTPPDEDGSADVKYVLDVARTFGQSIKKYTLLVTKSTVPVGTSQKVKEVVISELSKRGENIPFDIASNPEFLKEGSATKDFMTPDRVIVGVESEKAKELMSRLYRPLLLNKFRVIFMDIPSAEMTKYVANSMLATRISFMNEVAALCEKTGADVSLVRQGIAADTRIGNKFLYPGCGYGGSCFPKDVKALIKTASDNGLSMKIISAVDEVNNNQKKILYNKLNIALNSVENRVIAVWGLSFKPGTDDIREAPALTLIDQLLENGADIRVFDPIAIDRVRERYGDKIYYASSMVDAAKGADAAALVTEWKQFRLPDWQEIRNTMRGNVIVDGRNIYDPQEMFSYGFNYYSIGR